MDRRSFVTVMATAVATIGVTAEAFAAAGAPEDVGPGCEGAVVALKGWINALAKKDFDFLGVTARRMGDLVMTLVFAQINEEFRGDLGPQMPTAAEMNAFAKGKKLGYASGWREIDGRWECTSHHVLGEVNLA